MDWLATAVPVVEIVAAVKFMEIPVPLGRSTALYDEKIPKTSEFLALASIVRCRVSSDTGPDVRIPNAAFP